MPGLNRIALFTGCLAIAACSGSSNREEEAANGSATMPQADNRQVQGEKPIEAEPLPTIDPTSPAGAKAVVGAYAALAANGRYREAARYWTDADQAREFESSLEDYPKVQMTAGNPGEEDAGAGSIFIAIPVKVDLTLRSGSPFTMRCTAALRRVNNVPGATPRQLRWNIDSIDC